MEPLTACAVLEICIYVVRQWSSPLPTYYQVAQAILKHLQSEHKYADFRSVQYDRIW